ncbi:MAG TPA: hypothetical protein VK477_03620, partial [Acidobacteriota bacterium]|nr:hypothetical protein [Acidobacteriota bacterium]
MSKGTSTTLLRNLHLLPFFAVAVLGALALVGWWTGQVNWVQPRAYDVPLPANAAFCFLALGLTPLLCTLLPGRRFSAAPAFAATMLAVVALLSAQLHWWPGVADLLVRHDRLIEGSTIGRIPTLMAGLLVAAGALLAWLAGERPDPRRPLLLALVGSLACAYGFTAVLSPARMGSPR